MRVKIFALGLLCFALIACDKKIKNPYSPELPANQPIINYFTASPPQISRGESSTLSWSVNNAAEVMIDQNIGEVPLEGTREVNPGETIVYTLSAYDGANTTHRTVEVRVNPAPGETAIEIIGEPEFFYECYDNPAIPQYFNFQLTVKNISGRTIQCLDIILQVWAENPSGEWEEIFGYRWHGTWADWIPENILPDEEIFLTMPRSLSLGKDNDLCEKMSAGRPEFKFEAFFAD